MTSRLKCAGLVLVGLAAASTLSAQGSNVMQHGACATSMVSAGVASPCEDGSAVLFNPGALATQSSGVGIGVTLINTSADFTYDISGDRAERDPSLAPVPFGFANYRINDRLAAGFGLFAPYGLGIDWPMSFEGRFVTYETELRNIYLQPTLAYEVTPWLSLGAGLDIVLGSIDLKQRVDLAEQVVVNPATGQPVLNPVTNQPARFSNFGIPMGTDFADAHLAGDGTGFTFNVGAVAKLSEMFSVGIRYMHSAEIDYEGDATFEQVPTGLELGTGNPLGLPGGTPIDALLTGQFSGTGALVDQGLATSLTLPSQLVVGVAIRPIEQLKLLADYQFTGWESFDLARIDFSSENGRDSDLVLDYQDTHTWLFGAEYAVAPVLDLRAGFRFNTAAERDASVSPFLPEAERNYYTLGLGYDFLETMRLDLGYQLVDQSDRRGRVRNRASLDQTAEDLNVGVFSSEAHVFSVSVAYGFGPHR
jgi:long-chain fatty acid transport protein